MPDPMTLEQHAEAILRAAGSSLRHYTLNGTRQAILAACQALADDARKEAETDAARYRWLRDHSCPPHNFYVSVPDEFHGVKYAPADVDAYIDAAIAYLNRQPERTDP